MIIELHNIQCKNEREREREVNWVSECYNILIPQNHKPFVVFNNS